MMCQLKRQGLPLNFAVHDEKLFSAMGKWSSHCLYQPLSSERETGLDIILGVEHTHILINLMQINSLTYVTKSASTASSGSHRRAEQNLDRGKSAIQLEVGIDFKNESIHCAWPTERNFCRGQWFDQMGIITGLTNVCDAQKVTTCRLDTHTIYLQKRKFIQYMI